MNVEDTSSVAGQNLVLNGAALRKKFVVKVYVGALYLPSRQTSAAAWIGPKPRPGADFRKGVLGQ